MVNFNGQLNSIIIETHTVGMKRGKKNLKVFDILLTSQF